MASPLTFIHAPMASITARSSSEMVPSAFGPTFSSMQPFLLTMSTRSRTMSTGGLKSLPSV